MYIFLQTLQYSSFKIWKEIVDETLEDNTEEEIIRYLCGEQQ